MDRQLIQKEKIHISRHRKGKRKWSIGRFVLLVFVFLFGSIFIGLFQGYDLSPTGVKSYNLAPHPIDWEDPIVQIYAARTRGAKKILAVHTWIATKRRGADHYQISQVIGWRLNRSGTALFRKPGIPDKGWHGNEPILLLDLRGPKIESVIDKIDLAIAEYPWSGEYAAWPGPNSNTFIAWVGLEVPELGIDLPSTAIGKDWRPINHAVGFSASGTGIQASFFGLLGASIGYEEGLEVNILGLSTELDLFDMAVELPGFGRIGPSPVR